MATIGMVPDVLNYSWRDYGVRVGIWRLDGCHGKNTA